MEPAILTGLVGGLHDQKTRASRYEHARAGWRDGRARVRGCRAALRERRQRLGTRDVQPLLLTEFNLAQVRSPPPAALHREGEGACTAMRVLRAHFAVLDKRSGGLAAASAFAGHAPALADPGPSRCFGRSRCYAL